MTPVTRHLGAALLAATMAAPAPAAELEVTHWWTSGGEAAAIAELARRVNETGHVWVDGTFAGSRDIAQAIIVSRILGGAPMAATLLSPDRQTEALMEAGLLTDLTPLVDALNLRAVIQPPALLDSCTFDGRVYCLPVTLHTWQWLWLNTAAFTANGLDLPADWTGLMAAAPALDAAGLVPLAMGRQAWQQKGAFEALELAIAGPEAWHAVHAEGSAEAVMSPAYTAVFDAAVQARAMAAGSQVEDWRHATAMVVSGKAAAQIMGDWAQGEFAAAGQVAGTDYSCLPGLGLHPLLDARSDSFYFPLIDDAEIRAAQLDLARLLVSPEAQMAVNLRKGGLPVRGDVDRTAADACMTRGLELLAAGKLLPPEAQRLPPEALAQIDDLMAGFWASDMSAEEAQARYHDIVAAASVAP